MTISLVLAFATLTTPQSSADQVVSTCVETTITSRGRFTKRRIHISSGSTSFDANALRLLESIDLRETYPSVQKPQSGYLVVSQDQRENPGFTLMERLLSECPVVESDT